MRTISILAIVALASIAGAQSAPINLPMFLPPSYHSPHGGTGHADTITATPRPPGVSLPTPDIKAVPRNHFLDAVVELTDHGAASRLEKAKTRSIENCLWKTKPTEEQVQVCSQAREDERKAFDEWWESYKRTLAEAEKEAQRRQKQFFDRLNATGRTQ